MRKKAPKCLVLVSGGLDSAVLLAQAVQEFGNENVIALSLSYGQKHIKELECARYQARHYKVSIIESDLSDVFKFQDNPMLANSETAIPEKSYKEQLDAMGGKGTVSTYVPFRNGLFLAYATAIALQHEAMYLYYGAHSDDAAGSAYPDCTAGFINHMNSAIEFGTGFKVTMLAPFWKMTKKDIVAEGLQLGVHFEMTWSCYNGKEHPCGVCGTCIDRVAAFEANDNIDPLTQ